MNHKEHELAELELSQLHAREVLQCLLHTILFMRAPHAAKPREVHCDYLGLSYVKCGHGHLTSTVDGAIEACFGNGLAPAGPDLKKGRMILTFFEKRTSSGFFGLVQNQEKVVFEQWVIPFLIDVTPIPLGEDHASVVVRNRQQERAEALVRQRMLDIFAFINGHIDHIPPVTFQYDITFGPKRDKSEDFNTRVRNSPGLITSPI